MKNSVRSILLVSLMLSAGLSFLCCGPGKKEPAVFRNAVKIGNPGRHQYPDDSSEHIFARTVWDMHYFKGEIYIGTGDYYRNQGPVQIWHFSEEYESEGFQSEFTVDDESVTIFRSSPDLLLVPGIDAKESWDFGNLYLFDGESWTKRRTIPNGIHVMDAAFFKGNLYVYMTSEKYNAIIFSEDMGLTWDFFAKNYYENRRIKDYSGPMVAAGDWLVIFGRENNSMVVHYSRDGRKIDETRNLFAEGETRTLFPNRIVAYQKGVLFTGTSAQTGTLEQKASLFHLLPGDGTAAEEILYFHSANVRDILIRDKDCYVLTVTQDEDGYSTQIHSSSDLKEWRLAGEAVLPALPYSLEMMNDRFYVGLGHTFYTDRYREKKSDWASGSASGSIYQLK